MDYVLISVVFILGVAYHIMQKVMQFKKAFPNFKPNAIWQTFFNEEWDSLLVSCVVLVTLNVFLYIKAYNGWIFPEWLEGWAMYLFSLIMGYAGQRLAYRYLGTAEKALEKRVDSLNGNT